MQISKCPDLTVNIILLYSIFCQLLDTYRLKLIADKTKQINEKSRKLAENMTISYLTILNIHS